VILFQHVHELMSADCSKETWELSTENSRNS
jgi:hypothetical protein